MNELLRKFQPIDIIAMITIIGGLILKFSGMDGTVGAILTAIVLFYFGKKELVDKNKEKNPPTAKVETVEATIRRIAKAEGVASDLAVRVARCESGLNPNAKHTNPQGSIDRGLYQWNSRWHKEITDEVAFDIEKSTLAFCGAVKAGHLSWWDATKKCWDN